MEDSQPINSEQIKLMNQLYRLNQRIDIVQKTIIVYEIYDEQTENQLTNLHAIASRIMDPQIPIEIIKQQIEDDVFKYYHKVDPKDLTDHKTIKVFTFQLEDQGKSQYQWEKKIQIYDSTLDGKAIRIVTIPLPKHFFKADDVQAKVSEVDNMRITKAKQTRGLSYEKLEQKQQQWDQKIKAREHQFEEEEGRNHLRMFRLQALRSVLANKTQSISLCGILEFKKKDLLADKKKELASIFKFPSELQPQFIMYSFNPKTPKMPEYVNSPDISTIYNLNKSTEEMTLHKGGKQELFNKIHFTDNKEVSISLYSIRLATNNPYMATAIQKFTNGWSTTVSNSIIPIGFVVSSIYDGLNIKEDPNSSNFIEADTSFYTTSKMQPKNTQIIKFSNLAVMYNQFKGYYLEDNVELKDFYTLEKLKISKLQADEDMIPQSIDRLTFLFYFCKINKEFLQKFTAIENEGYDKIIKAIEDYIQTVCELINHINDTLLAKNQNLENRCKDLRKYLQFIKFLLSSTIMIKNIITNKALAVTGNIRNFFDGLKLKDSWIISYIISNEAKIIQGEPIHYYDFLLRFIKNEKKQNDKQKNDNQIADDENIGSIFVTIHKFKADQIAKKFICDKARVVEAIKSYCQIIRKYDRLVVQKKKMFDKFEIEKKVARLLCVIGLPAEAAKIYQRLHMVEKVEECFKQIIIQIRGVKRTNKILEFAQFFEDEFAYTLAQKYYQKAYCTAKTSESRKKAQENLLQCRKRQRTERVNDVAIIVRYTADKGNEEDFVKTPFSTRQKENSVAIENAETQYPRLLTKLSWDESKKESVILNQTYLEDVSISSK